MQEYESRLKAFAWRNQVGALGRSQQRFAVLARQMADAIAPRPGSVEDHLTLQTHLAPGQPINRTHASY